MRCLPPSVAAAGHPRLNAEPRRRGDPAGAELAIARHLESFAL